MVDLAAFRALRFEPGTDLGEVTAPPYDAIDERLAQRLRERHPHNVVRLELSSSERRDPDSAGRYERARSTYEEWRRSGVLRLDTQESLTVYEQRLPDGHLQRGVLAAVRLEPWEARLVLPHERVFPGPVADRLRLLRALPVNLSPIYLLARTEPAPAREVIDEVTSTEPDAAFADHEVHHRIWQVTDEASIASVVRAYRDERLLVADGHHRYTTALEYLREVGHSVPGAERILAYVVGGGPEEDQGPIVRPMHRLVEEAVDDPLRALAEAGFDLQREWWNDVGDAGRPQRALSALRDPDVVCVVATATQLLRVRGRGGPAEPAGGSGGRSPADGLDVAVVDRRVIPALLRASQEVPATPDAGEAFSALTAGDLDVAILVRPVALSEVWAVASAGDRMPPKSTSFHPKPRTGLVLRPLGST